MLMVAALGAVGFLATVVWMLADWCWDRRINFHAIFHCLPAELREQAEYARWGQPRCRAEATDQPRGSPALAGESTKSKKKAGTPLYPAL